MGTFADYVGKLDIPEEKRSEYAQQMLTLLHAGGMLSVDGVGLFGRRIQLFYPPELGEDHCTRGWYNYFEDDCWGPWEFNADAGIFCPDKIGSGAFHTVVVAANILTALYSKNYNIVAVDGEYIREHNYIGWLNSVLGTQYTNWRTTQLWEIAKLLYKEGWCTGWHSDLTILLKDVPAACIDTAQLEFYLAACHLDKYIEIIAPMREGTATLRKRDSTSVSNLCAHLRKELSVFHTNGGTLEGAKNLLTVSEENHSTAVREGVDRLPFLYSLVPPVLAAALTAKSSALTSGRFGTVPKHAPRI